MFTSRWTCLTTPNIYPATELPHPPTLPLFPPPPPPPVLALGSGVVVVFFKFSFIYIYIYIIYNVSSFFWQELPLFRTPLAPSMLPSSSLRPPTPSPSGDQATPTPTNTKQPSKGLKLSVRIWMMSMMKAGIN